MTPISAHRERILDQFTRQAVPFSTAPAIRNEDALKRIVRMADAGPEDVSLDVACGPGLLVCAFAQVVKHATGLDMTPAMLEQARATQQKFDLRNIAWRQGEAVPLPFPAASFSIVSARFAFHHFLDPLAALKEMARVLKPGGRIVVADSAPQSDKAQAFNFAEKLRDPSHVRALPLEELRELFRQAGLADPRIESYRLEGELEDLLQRSFPNEGDADRIRQLYADSVASDNLDMAVRSEDGKVFYGFPVAILAAGMR